MGTWERKLDEGAQRLGCMSCGAHVLVVDGHRAACQCCGDRDLRPVPVAERHQHEVDDPRRRFLREWAEPALLSRR